MVAAVQQHVLPFCSCDAGMGLLLGLLLPTFATVLIAFGNN